MAGAISLALALMLAPQNGQWVEYTRDSQSAGWLDTASIKAEGDLRHFRTRLEDHGGPPTIFEATIACAAKFFEVSAIPVRDGETINQVFPAGKRPSQLLDDEGGLKLHALVCG